MPGAGWMGVNTPNLFKQTPGRALLAFAIAALLVALFTFVDAGKRADLEGYDRPTALGDAERFPFEEQDRFDLPVMRFGGTPLFRRVIDPQVRFDKYMFKVGREDGDRCSLYHYQSPKGDRTPDGIYWVKVDDGLYIEVGAAPPAGPAPVEGIGDGE